MSIPLVSSIQAIAPTTLTPAVQDVAPSDGSAFGASLAGAIDNLQQLQTTSDNLAVQAVTGNLDDIHDATIAATRAQTTMDLVATVRNKGIEAFNQIMTMQA
jgi:flagellar hook-basal body complex protein FliE